MNGKGRFDAIVNYPKGTGFEEFKNNTGEYKRWLHIFIVGRAGNYISVRFLPWLFKEDKLDLVALEGFSRLGAFKHYPGRWSRPDLFELTPATMSPHYYAITTTIGEHGVIEAVNGSKTRGNFDVYDKEFWLGMRKRVIVPTRNGLFVPTFITVKQKEFTDEGFRPSSIGPSTVRDR